MMMERPSGCDAVSYVLKGGVSEGYCNLIIWGLPKGIRDALPDVERECREEEEVDHTAFQTFCCAAGETQLMKNRFAAYYSAIGVHHHDYSLGFIFNQANQLPADREGVVENGNRGGGRPDVCATWDSWVHGGVAS